MRTNFHLLIFLSVFIAACEEDSKIPITDDMKEYGLSRPAKVIHNKESWYVDSLGVRIDSDADSATNNYFFDSTGHLIKSELWNIPRKGYLIETWTYDSIGRKSTYTFDRGGGPCDQRAQYFYDTNNRITHKEIYSGEDSLLNIEFYKYDKMGNLVETRVEGFYQACGYCFPYLLVYEYDDEGRISRHSNSSERGTSIQLYKHIDDTTFRYKPGEDYRSGNMTITEDYDEHGTWRKKTFTYRLDSKKTQVFTTTRTIEYY